MSLSQITHLRQIHQNLCAAFECRPFGLKEQNPKMSTQLHPVFENFVSNNLALTCQRLSQVPSGSRPSKLDTRSQINEEVRRLCNLGKLEAAWQILNRINCEDKVTLSDVYVCLLRACTNMRVLTEGKRVHAHLIKSTFQPDIFLTNTLLNMYANCASIVETEAILYRMVSKNVYTWTIMLAGYTRLGHDREALVLFQDMQDEGVSLDKVTFICVLVVCATLGALEQGRLVHAHIVKSGLLSGVFIENTLISMYTRCASIEEAGQVFCHMSLQDNVSWNALILGYVHHGNDRQVLSNFQQMEQKGMIPNKVAFIGILNACVNLSSLDQGEHVHVQIKEAGYGSDLFVCNKLIDMYSKCGNIESARGVFNNMSIRNIVSWTSIITGYAQLSMGEEALNLFCALQDEGIDPNEITFVSVLSACGTLGVLEQAKWVHSHVIKSGCMSNQFVGNTLIDMYAKCGSLEAAEYSFDRLPLRNVVSWNALITGYTIHQNGVVVVRIFQQMQQERMSPNLVTFSNIINACAASGNLGHGKYVHSLLRLRQMYT